MKAGIILCGFGGLGNQGISVKPLLIRSGPGPGPGQIHKRANNGLPRLVFILIKLVRES
jgi:hypothetical protein